MKIDEEKWDKLIEEHYLAACKNRSDYSEKYSREEMKKWWLGLISKSGEKFIEDTIIGLTQSLTNGHFYHPV